MTQPPNAPSPAGGLRVAHVSDLHILDVKGVMPWRYLGKRLTGGANLLFKRKGLHQTAVVIQALEQIAALGVDHLVVTGDLSNLALETEFEAGVRTLQEFAGGPERVSVIPGNHDYYTVGSALTGRFEAFFKSWMKSDLPIADGANYPYVKLLGSGVALVGINSCIPSPPMLAVGRVGARQRRRLEGLLADPALEGRFVIAALHHHLLPPKYTTRRHELMHGLRDNAAVCQVLLDGGADLVIHGHNHQHSNTTLERPAGGQMHICEAGSTSVSHHRDPHFGGKFNIYDLTPGPDGVLRLGRVTTHLYEGPERGFEVWSQVEAPFDAPAAP